MGFTWQAGFSSGKAAGGRGARWVWPRLAVGPFGGRDVPGLVAAAPWGRAPGCGEAACAPSRRARVRSGISLRISASKNATASSGIRYAYRGGKAWANARAMTCLSGAGSWARPCGVIELTCAALRWPAPDAGR